MANTIATRDVLLWEFLNFHENGLAMASKIASNFSNEFGNIGDSLEIRRPVRFELLETPGFTVSDTDFQDIQEGRKKITLDQALKLKPFGLSVEERTLEVGSEALNMWLENAVSPMSERIETAVGEQYKSVYNNYGNWGDKITTRAQIGRPVAKMKEIGVRGQFMAFHDPSTADDLLDIITGTFDDKSATPALRDSTIGRLGNVRHYETVHIPNHTVGNHGGAPVVDGATQEVAYDTVMNGEIEQTLNTRGWTASEASLLSEGDIVHIAGVNAVNIVTKKDTGRPQDFTVRAAAGSDGAGNAQLVLAPAIITTGAQQNVSAAPADGAVITVKGTAGSTYRQSMMFLQDAFTLVSRPLDIEDANLDVMQKSGNRMSLSYAVIGDFYSYQSKHRMDGLYKVDATDPLRAMRLLGEEVN